MGAAGDHFVAALQEHVHHRLGVDRHLLLVNLELRLHRFFQRHRLAGDHVHQRAALAAREHGGVQLLVQLFVAALRQDQAAARTRQGFVGGGSDDVRVRYRVRIHAGGDQASHVRHVDEQVSADAVGDFAHFGPVNHAGVSGEAADDHFRLVGLRLFGQIVIVDLAFVVDAVRHHVIQFAGQVNRGTVGQVAAVRQVHAQNGVARLQQRGVHGEVSLGAGVRLHVGVIGAEQFFGTIDSQLLNDIHVFAAAVVTLARIAFSVFVGQLGTLSLHHARAGVVLRRDQLDVLFLTHHFLLHGTPQFRIVIGNVHFTL